MSDFDVGAYTAFSVGPDLAKARNQPRWLLRLLRWALRRLCSSDTVFHSVRLKPSVQLSEAGKWGEVGPLVDDNMIDAFVIAGDADTCNKKIEALLDTGVTAGHNWQPTGPDVEEAIKICGTT